ncbi:MAG: hypothetical protein F6K41_12600 [Symploca sp. SIO3E6]|nr:hypothetical protein [Caldora sp. SIO3E6]
MLIERQEEFDVLRALLIINAIIIHFHERCDLELLAIIPLFIHDQGFRVGNFFFFTSGYMGYKIYLNRFKENKKTVIKLFKKGLQIFLLYIGYITFMRLAMGSWFPVNIYEFLFYHRFFNAVLCTFSVLFLISPIFIFIYTKSKNIFLVCTLLLFSVYAVFIYSPIPENIVNSELSGVLLGIGSKSIYYSIVPALITYCLGFLIASYDKITISEEHQSGLLLWIPFLVLTVHSVLVVLSESYRTFVNMKVLVPLVSSILVFSSLLLIRFLLLNKIIRTTLTKPEFMLIGKKTLIFFVTSNMILGFLNLSEQSPMLNKFVIFSVLLWLTYIVAAWSFYSELYKKANQN